MVPLQLAADTFRPQEAEFLQCGNTVLKLLVGAELGGVLLHIGAIRVRVSSIIRVK